MNMKPQIIQGGNFIDHRGEMRFVNDFKFDDVVRFYFIKHPDVHFVRAWQGHQFEKKYFYPITGSFVVAWVKIDNFEHPSPDLVPEYHIINALKSEIVMIPKGYANGIKALEPNSELMIFSDMEVKESVKEKIRFEARLWFDWENCKPLNLKAND
jgi:dTDP-4-dehydrorhamnose 3,5-epimerase